jgi:hypothetical protein
MLDKELNFYDSFLHSKLTVLGPLAFLFIDFSLPISCDPSSQEKMWVEIVVMVRLPLNLLNYRLKVKL